MSSVIDSFEKITFLFQMVEELILSDSKRVFENSVNSLTKEISVANQILENSTNGSFEKNHAKGCEIGESFVHFTENIHFFLGCQEIRQVFSCEKLADSLKSKEYLDNSRTLLENLRKCESTPQLKVSLGNFVDLIQEEINAIKEFWPTDFQSQSNDQSQLSEETSGRPVPMPRKKFGNQSFR